MPCYIVANPGAGRGRVARLLDRCANAIARHWGTTEILVSHDVGQLRSLSREAASDGDRIFALGGDGTVHEVANAIHESGHDTVLGVIPVGSGNDFARLCGLRQGPPEAAIEMLALGSVRRFDLGRAWGEYFVNSLGVGLDAAVAARANAMSKLSGLASYLSAALLTLPRFEPLRLRIVAGPTTLEKSVLALEVGNGWSCGGGFRLTPDADPQDGVLDICLIEPLGLMRAVRHAADFIHGRHTSLPWVTMLRHNQVTVSSGNEILAHLDGESRTGPSPLQIELVPAALSVMTGSNQ